MINHTELAKLVNVTKIFGDGNSERATLEHVSFTARRGEMTLLLGPSGSGKTTLLTLLAGLQRPTYGEAYLFGKRVDKYSKRELQHLRAQHVGFIFQSFYLIESLTAIENVILALKFAGVDRKEARRRAASYLDTFGVGHLKTAYPAKFSQGEKQRVAVARALATNAELIIADEPTGSLATQQGMLIVEILKDRVERDKLCAVIASHDERIGRYADRVLHLRDGALQEKY